MVYPPLACGPGHPELSKSYMDMASKLFTFTFPLTWPRRRANEVREVRPTLITRCFARR